MFMFLPEFKISLHKNLNGFTIIELIITIAISVLLFSFGIVRYIDFNKTQTIKAAGQTFKNNLRNIQNKALSGAKPVTGVCTALVGYRLTISTTTTYVVQAVCDVNNLIGSSISYSLPAGLRFNAPAVASSVDLKVLGQGASNPTVFMINNSLTAPTKWYGVCITASGDIRDCGYNQGAAPVCSC